MSLLKIKNKWLAFLALCLFCFFIALGLWQLDRAKQKERLIANYEARQSYPPLTSAELLKPADYRFFRVTLTGTFDNQHTFLLDNKTLHGQVGYEIYTPFQSKDLPFRLLVDRGFIPLGASREQLPVISPINGVVALHGVLNHPPAYVAFGKIVESKALSYPLRVEFINLNQLSTLLKTPLSPYVVHLTPKVETNFTEWQVVTIPPERHRGYAVQWFALALTLLILFISLNRDTKSPSKRIQK